MKFNLPEPFAGAMVIEGVKENAKDYMKEKSGLKEHSHLANAGFEIAVGEYGFDEETGNRKWEHKSSLEVPLKKGRILSMAPDCFGEAYKKRFGTDFTPPKIGDVVLFIPMQSFKLDPEGTYHLIADDDVKAVYRQ